MKAYLRLHIIFALLSAAFFTACESAKPQISVENAWARPTAGANQDMQHAEHMSHQNITSAVYFSLVNVGRAADRLIKAESDISNVVEIHQTKMENDKMMMAMVQGGVEVPPRGQVEFKPGGYHIMLIGVKQGLKAGDTFQLTLTFEKSGQLTVEPEVRQP